MNKLYIYDSVKKEKVEFNPIVEGKVKIYVCGPTVYDDSHFRTCKKCNCILIYFIEF